MKRFSKLMGTAAVIVMVAAAGLVSTNNAQAAVVRSYADGPVLYLNKWETRYAGKTNAALAGGLIVALTGGWGWAAGASIAAISDTYVEQQVSRGYCLLVKMWYWNPLWVSTQWYSWWPCS